MSNQPIDFVVPFVDDTDSEWQNLFKKYNYFIPSRQRYHDNGTLLYQLRGIENFMPWIRYIFLIVQSESQIPNWIRKDHPRLKIVLHKDYIPEQYLPTFKSSNIENNVHHIKDLSENFILANDDMIPIKPISENRYFKGDRPVLPKEENPYYVAPSSESTMQNTIFRISQLERIYLNSVDFKGLKHKHLFIPYNKTFWRKVIERFKFSFEISFKEKNYRGFMDLNHWLISDMQIIDNFAIVDNSVNTSGYISLTNETTEEEVQRIIETSEVICLNDCMTDDSNLSVIPNTIGKLLSVKSSFEK